MTRTVWGFDSVVAARLTSLFSPVSLRRDTRTDAASGVSAPSFRRSTEMRRQSGAFSATPGATEHSDTAATVKSANAGTMSGDCVVAVDGVCGDVVVAISGVRAACVGTADVMAAGVMISALQGTCGCVVVGDADVLVGEDGVGSGVVGEAVVDPGEVEGADVLESSVDGSPGGPVPVPPVARPVGVGVGKALTV
nr:hypothetical protein [Arthrobacter sp. ZGTC131]